MTLKEKREALISWINQMDEFALDEILVENLGFNEKDLDK